MKRLVLLNDEVVELPEALAQAIERAPVIRRPPKEKVKPKAFANPYGRGYGDSEETPWPFDVKRAYVDGRYRAGIRNAINADWTASNWKFAARHELQQVLINLIAAYDVVEDESSQ